MPARDCGPAPGRSSRHAGPGSWRSHPCRSGRSWLRPARRPPGHRGVITTASSRTTIQATAGCSAPFAITLPGIWTGHDGPARAQRCVVASAARRPRHHQDQRERARQRATPDTATAQPATTPGKPDTGSARPRADAPSTRAATSPPPAAAPPAAPRPAQVPATPARHPPAPRADRRSQHQAPWPPRR